MPITINQRQSHYVTCLQGAITISCAAELKRLLLEALASGKDVQVDLEQATTLDVTAMQLLWAARRESERSGTAFAVVGQVPEQISVAVRDAGFESLPVSAAPK